MKLAYFSPLRPQASGISDYSETLLPHLAKAAEITLFVDGFHPVNPELISRFQICDYRRQRSLLRSLEEFDAVVYHMGNDHRYHSGILDAMQVRPGIVVLHDFALQDFFLGLARERNRPELYLDEVEFCYGKQVRAAAEESLTRGAAPAIFSRPLEFPLNDRIISLAEGIIVHSKGLLDRLKLRGVPAIHIPHFVEFDEVEHVSSTSGNEVRIASFGLITPGKGIELVLRALSKLRKQHRFRYTLVGEPNFYYDVRQLIRDHGMTDLVDVTGHVDLEQFKQHMRETDIAVNIRERTVGETSGCLCRLMSSGVCSVVADVGWYSELPNDSVVKVPLDSHTDSLLLAYLERLIEDEPLRKRIGENAKGYAHAHHNITQIATAYLDFIAEVIDQRTKHALISTVSNDLVELGAKASDEAFLQSVARELSALVPDENFVAPERDHLNAVQSNGNRWPTPGRTAKLDGIDYKEAARDYLRKIPEERRHHLRTKPFYNLANKPAKYRNEGMDEDTHRHFCDFANIAVTLALPAGSRLLDVGCGSGWLSEYFARLGYVVKGIDISPDLIQMSEERVARVPYGVDHETPLRCTFAVHDIEASPLLEKFDAIICYDSLHHFEDESAVIRNLAAMLDVGGLLFVLEGDRPPAGSPSEHELRDVMTEFGTLESPFDFSYLRKLLDEHGFAIIGDYASVNGLFQRETIVDDHLPLTDVAVNYNYLACKKVVEGAAASSVPDSRNPNLLRAHFEFVTSPPARLAAGQMIELEVEVTNEGNTFWIAGRQTRLGVVMPAVKIFDDKGTLVREFHGEPPLPHSVAPSETVRLRIRTPAPQQNGRYVLKLDLVNQHVCWFEDAGSDPLTFEFSIDNLNH